MNRKSKGKQIIYEGAISLTIATVAVKILGAIYKIPISHILGEEGMGYYNAAYTVYSFFYLVCTAGVPKAIMIICGEEENREKHGSIIRAALIFFAIVGITVSATFALTARHLARLIGSPDSYQAMLLITPSILFSSISGVIRGYFSSKVKFMHVAVSQVIEGVGKLIFGIMLALAANGIGATLNMISAFAILGATIGNVCGFVYLIIMQKRENSGEIRKQKLDIDATIRFIRLIINISLPIAINAMIMSITNIIDLFVVMNRLSSFGVSAKDATSYFGNYTTFATPLFNAIVSLFTPLTIAYMPALIECKNNRRNFIGLLENELDTSFFLFVPLIIGLCVYSEEALIILFDDKGVYLGSKLLVYLLMSIFFLIPLSIINCSLEALGNAKATTISMLVGAIFKLTLGYILIGEGSFGILGAPISTIAFYGSALIASSVIAYKKESIILPVLKSMFKPLIYSFIAIYTLYPIYTFISAKVNWIITMIITSILSVALYLCLNILGKKVNLKTVMPLKSISNISKNARY